MEEILDNLIYFAGFGQLSVLVASALVPIQMDWKREFAPLPRLHRQMYWVYGGYVVMAIIAFGLICIINSRELAAGSLLARSLCGYMTIFWGVRLSLQTFLDVKSHLTKWWLTAGYYTLTLFFLSFTLIFATATLHPAK